ncbi:hypothetical protein [Pantoea stewartii]|uniref:hypothetical protein n=1 Tax=Pantoea stewartii TaxID=66269 RepID=UPI00092F6371|nr:hypothetical protein [Pantoea stewartii]
MSQYNPLNDFVEPDFKSLLAGVDIELVFSFFNYFSRFEHALKMCGYKKVDSQGFLTGVDWRSFEPDISFPTHVEEVDKAISYLCENPVKRQRENLFWREVEAITPPTFRDALRQIPYIRNNLFHGSKYLRPDSARDNRLLSAAIILIKCCLISNQDLHYEFDPSYR